jgi:hypothetical protein
MTRQPIPTDAASCRALIATESVRRERTKRLRNLFKLLRCYETAEQRALEDRKLTAAETANRLKQDEADAKKRDYVLRFVARPLGQRQLLKRCEILEKEVAELRSRLAGVLQAEEKA